MPAASSMRPRRSSGRDDTMKPMRPCSMIAYAFEPTPVPRKNSTTSRRRDGTPFSRYSLLPSRYRRRVTTISSGAAAPQGTPPGAAPASSALPSNVSDTSARPAGPRLSEPAKMTSSIARPRRCLADCSPMTQRMASTMFDLPHPFGPDDRRDRIGKRDGRLVDEGLEPANLDALDLQPRLLAPCLGDVTLREMYRHSGALL